MSNDYLPMIEANIENVQIDSLVIMKLVKHVDSEFYSGMSEVAGDTCQGILTGLLLPEDRRMEITNCFPTPRPEITIEGEDTTTVNDEKPNDIVEMLKRFRQMNIDYELVGFYQAHLFGACYTHEMVDSLLDYQGLIPGGLVLIYDPVSTRQGKLSIRALRFTPKAFELCNSTDMSPEVVKNSGVTFNTLFQELPITIKNSRLMNVMLAELRLLRPKPSSAHLELGTRNGLEKSLRAMIADVEELNKSIGAFNKYTMEKQRYDALINSLIQKRQLENEARVARGEPRLSIDEIKTQHKMPQLQTKNGMLELFLNSCGAEAYANYTANTAADNICKLFISESAGQSVNLSSKRESPL